MSKKFKTIVVVVNPDDDDSAASNKECSEYYFTLRVEPVAEVAQVAAAVDDHEDQPVVDDSKKSVIYVCKCGTEKKSHPNIYTNRIDHLKRDHPGFRLEVTNIKKQNPSSNIMAAFTCPSGVTIHSWMYDVITHSLPLDYVTKESIRDHSRLKSISVKTLKKYINLTGEAVERAIATKLPKKFGIMLDGWSHGDVHYLAIYSVSSAEFDDNPNFDPEKITVKETYLLSFGVIMDDWHTDMTAESHRDYVKFVIVDVYKKSLEDLLFLVGILTLGICVIEFIFM